MSEAEIQDLEEDRGEIVHWFDRPPVSVSPLEAGAALFGAFALGALSTVGLLAITGHLRR